MATLEDRAKKITAYQEDLGQRRVNWENQWQEIADHAVGRRDFSVIREPGRQRMVRIYDTTAKDAGGLLSAALHSLLTNPQSRWQDIRFSNQDLNEIEPARFWLEDVKLRVTNAFTKPGSGFATQIAELYQDLVFFGSGCIFVEDDPGFGPRFSARPISEIYIDVDSTGRVKAVFRKFDLKHWQAVDQFGAEAIPAVAEAAVKAPNDESEFLHHVRRRGAPLPGKIDASGMEWESIYISKREKAIVDEGGFHENPYLIARWAVDAGELYGRGPGNDSLPEAKMLNAIWRTYIRNIEKAADPPLLVENDGVMPGSQISVTPSAQIVVQSDGNTEPVRYLESRAQLNWSAELIESRTKKIERAFHNEIIQAFQDPRMTATQVIELARLAQRQLSPVLGRMQEDLLNPLIERVYGILTRRRDFPRPPEEIVGEDLRIEYVSPVARAQKASESQSILDSFAAAQAVAQVDPSVMDNIDLDEAIRAIFVGNGTPVNIVRSKADVIEIRRTQAQVMEQEREAQQLAQTGETVSKLLPGIAKLQEVNQPG
jgi:hypothetical protein